MSREFTLFMGPMASGKSSHLVTELDKYSIAGEQVVGVNPELNQRDASLESRNGLRFDAVKTRKLGAIAVDEQLKSADVVGVDEIFMFEPDDAKETVTHWLSQNKIVLASTLDISAMGRMPDTVTALLELSPEIQQTQAVCETCSSLDGRFTLIYDRETDSPIRSGLPDVVPDDGVLKYQPACRPCFMGWNQTES